MSTIKELDAVALTCDLPEHRLARGDVGTAVLCMATEQPLKLNLSVMTAIPLPC